MGYLVVVSFSMVCVFVGFVIVWFVFVVYVVSVLISVLLFVVCMLLGR